MKDQISCPSTSPIKTGKDILPSIHILNKTYIDNAYLVKNTFIDRSENSKNKFYQLSCP